MDPLNAEAAEIDKILRQAHVLQMRGEKARAAELVQQAAELGPTNPGVLELQGDMLLELGKIEDARDAFQKSLDVEPGRVSAEKKHANAVFLLQERVFQRQQMEMALLHPELAQKTTVPRKPALSVLLSLVIPGAGQLYNGQYFKGGIVLGLSALVMLYALLHPGLHGFIVTLGELLGGKRDAGSPDFMLTLGLFLDTVLYVYSAVDAAVVGARLSSGYRAPNRPMPLSDLDSEPPRV